MQLTVKLNETDEKGLLTLDLALSTGQEDLALNLIEHKVNVDQKNTTGSTSLHSAITRGISSILKRSKNQSYIEYEPDTAKFYLLINYLRRHSFCYLFT